MYNAYRYVIANDGIDTAKSYPYHEQVYTYTAMLQSLLTV